MSHRGPRLQAIKRGLMVYTFECDVSQPDLNFDIEGIGLYIVYMGKDKYENEEMLKYSQKENLWFHVEKLSSAHLYLQLHMEEQEEAFENLRLNKSLLEQVGQLTKANSIKGLKLSHVSVVYTPVDNLHKDGSMEVGAVTFEDPRDVSRFDVSKDNSILNKLSRTKQEITIEEFASSQIENDRKMTNKRKNEKWQQRRNELEEIESAREQKIKTKNAYEDLFSNCESSSNKDKKLNWDEDDFM